MLISEKVKIDSERIDDISVIVEWRKLMEVTKFIDQKLSPLHGNNKGLSYGQLSVRKIIDFTYNLARYVRKNH
jgi:hypothetical protein